MTEDLVSARADWVAQFGEDAGAQFDAAAGLAPRAQPPQHYASGLPAFGTAPAPSAAPTAQDHPAQQAPAGSTGPIQWGGQDASRTVAELRSRGAPDANLRLAMQADGLKAEQITALLAAAPADTRSESEHEWERSGLAPAAKASEYRPIDWQGRLSPSADIHATDAGAREFLAAIGAPALLGPSLIEDAMDAGKAYRALPEAHRELFHRTEDQSLTDLLGPEAARETTGKIVELLKNAPKPFVAMLADTGALRSASVRYQLANIANMRGLHAAVKGGASLDLSAALFGT